MPQLATHTQAPLVLESMPPAWASGGGSSPPAGEDAEGRPADHLNGNHRAGTGKRKAALHAMKAVSETLNGAAVKKQRAAAASKAKPSTAEAAAEPVPALNGRQRAASGGKAGIGSPVSAAAAQTLESVPEPDIASHSAGKKVLAAPVKHRKGAAAAAALAHLGAPAKAAANGAVDDAKASSGDASQGDVTPTAVPTSHLLPPADETPIYTDGIALGRSKRKTPAELREDVAARARERAEAAVGEEAAALAAEQVKWGCPSIA